MLLSSLSLSGQSVGPAAPAPAAPPPELQPSASDAGLLTVARAPVQWGPVGVRPHAFYRLSHGDGLQSRPGERVTTTISTLSAGLLFDLGTRWSADYTPTWTAYSNAAFRNTVDHALSLSGSAGFTDGSLSFSQTYEKTDSPRVETGRQTKQESANTSLAGSYSLSRKTRYQASIGRSARSLDSAPDSEDWSLQNWLHYQLSDRTNVAVGYGIGYVKIEPGTDMSYIRPQVRVGWRPTSKLSFDVHGGSDQRRFRKAGLEKMSNPNYGAAGYYQPFETTTLSIGADRGFSASYFAGQVNEKASWQLGLNQRLFQRFNFNATASRSQVDYISTGGTALAVVREDEVESYSFRLGTSFLRRGSIGIVYQHTRNRSSASDFTFRSNQVGLEIGYHY